MGAVADHRLELRHAIQAPSPPGAARRGAELVVVADQAGNAPIRLLGLAGAWSRPT